jgi:hypothetical protein
MYPDASPVGAVLPLALIMPVLVTLPTVVFVRSMQVMAPVLVGLVKHDPAKAGGAPLPSRIAASELEAKRPSL